jgi:glycosyltransferase involved in cell wall biosynthesis
VPENRISVACNAIDYGFWRSGAHQARDLRREYGWGADTFVYLYFGRPGVSKGVEDLVRAAGQVRRARPDSRLVLLLSREPRAGRRRVERLIGELDLADHVLLLDPVPREQLPGYLLAADCVVVPSFSEGFGCAALEARTLGCRVLATRGHAVEEILADEAEWVAAGDVADLAERLAAMPRQPIRLAPPPQRYTPAAHVRAMEDIYDLAVSGGPQV